MAIETSAAANSLAEVIDRILDKSIVGATARAVHPQRLWF